LGFWGEEIDFIHKSFQRKITWNCIHVQYWTCFKVQTIATNFISQFTNSIGSGCSKTKKNFSGNFNVYKFLCHFAPPITYCKNLLENFAIENCFKVPNSPFYVKLKATSLNAHKPVTFRIAKKSKKVKFNFGDLLFRVEPTPPPFWMTENPPCILISQKISLPQLKFNEESISNCSSFETSQNSLLTVICSSRRK
jgi:hypothetical protein